MPTMTMNELTFLLEHYTERKDAFQIEAVRSQIKALKAGRHFCAVTITELRRALRALV